jgi:hypothetical protein
MATTTNYSWSTPDDVSLVKDGASAIRTLGSSADTTVKALNPGTTAGDIDYYTTSTAKARVGIGTAGQVLQVNSGATAPEWATPSSGGMTLISTTTLSGTTPSITSIPTTYNDLQLIIRLFKPSVDGRVLRLRVNNDSTANRYLTGINNATWGTVGSGSQTFDSDRFNTDFGPADDTITQSIIKVNFIDYTNTSTWKLIDFIGITNDNTTATNITKIWGQGVYNQTAAITTINFLLNNTGDIAGTALLYGVK